MDSEGIHNPYIWYSEYMRGTNVEIKPDVHKLLKIRAAKEGLSISDTIAMLLKKRKITDLQVTDGLTVH